MISNNPRCPKTHGTCAREKENFLDNVWERYIEVIRKLAATYNFSNRSKSSKERYTFSLAPSGFNGISGATVTEQPNQTARELPFDSDNGMLHVYDVFSNVVSVIDSKTNTLVSRYLPEVQL